MMKPLNCNGCTACCRADAIFLKDGDNPDDYQTVQYMGKTMLAHKKDGACIYVTNKGCRIHGKQPIVCREFDCRALLKQAGYTTMRKWAKKGIIKKALLQIATRKLNE